MPLKHKAVKEADIKSAGPPTTRSTTRSRNKQLQASANPLSNAGHLETRAMSSAPKQNAARKRGPWGEDYLMTSTKSALVHADLVRLFSNPKAWECLEEDEKRELISLLPAHIHPNPDPDPNNPEAKIPPLPESFLRYDNNWRAALRNFQSDLEAGRYRPDWQRQAKQAVQERAQGKFDDFKEREFEQFWGQKQKISYGLIAGESSKVKLETLIAHDVVRVGDVWKYCRVFGGKKAPIVVEKEVKITAIEGAKLSFLMPTGQRVFLCAVGESKTEDEKVEKGKVEDIKSEDEKMDVDRIEKGTVEKGKTEAGETKGEVKDDTQMDIDPVSASQPGEHATSPIQGQPPRDESSPQYYLAGVLNYATQSNPELKGDAEKDGIVPHEADTTPQQPEAPRSLVTRAGTRRKRGCPAKRKFPHDAAQVAAVEVNRVTEAEATKAPREADVNPSNITEKGADPEPVPESAREEEHKNADSSQQPITPWETDAPETATSCKADESEPAQCSATTATPLEIEIHNIAGPNALMKKILETDGRVKNPPNGNAWKEIRCYRKNQDMGSLWEVRQAWYVKYRRE
ncbi:hypothetical protein EYB26_000257 [Talaromyces marneffei]|uniref:uncharacterized protein n=1 Tax=Talaromyces marneffei TaxID=37727 RepID=UPI0012AA3829|nr:uncharacterized protein EYB26_000257 [Talaromyces marneffei]QGA12613.1 hypothetical protein EYB26_000257 [Talaromyces marneffei]